jgi:quercetin dioxygenase-like cupin family protein
VPSWHGLLILTLSQQRVFIRLAPHGILGRHPAPTPQLMVVIHGEGDVCGEDPGSMSVRPGVAIRWNAGEQHETRAGESGLVLLILEAADPKLGLQH